MPIQSLARTALAAAITTLASAALLTTTACEKKKPANAFEEVLLGSTTNAVINESHTDVLISTRAESPR